MMLWKNRNKRVRVCLTVVTSFLVLVAAWAILATPKTTLAKKPVTPGDEATRYDVTMEGDLTIVGGFNLDPGQNPPEDWGVSFETGIRVTRPRPKICVKNAFLATGGVTFDGETCGDCGDGVIPDGNGHPNWGVLKVEGDASAVTVTWYIGETDAITGKIRLYTLTTNGSVPVVTRGNGTWPKGGGDGSIYTITIPGPDPTEAEPGMSWSLVPAKPGRLDTILTSTQDTVITFTEYTGS